MKTLSPFTLAFSILMIYAGVVQAQNNFKGFKAYLSVTTQDKALENIDMQKSGIEDKLKDILTSEGIQIIPGDSIEKHGESYLYIYVTLKDSLTIHAGMSYPPTGKNSVLTGLYPDKSYFYKTAKDAAGSFKQYIREYITKSKVQKNMKK